MFRPKEPVTIALESITKLTHPEDFREVLNTLKVSGFIDSFSVDGEFVTIQPSLGADISAVFAEETIFIKSQSKKQEASE